MQDKAGFKNHRTKMGCICSKVMARSMSFKEDFNQSLQGRDNSLPVLEELFISRNVGDELFPLVCTFNTMENKSQTGSFIQESNKSHSPDAEPVDTETAKPPKVVECADFNMTRRSKSCHWSFPGHDVLSLALGISNGVKEMGFDWSNKGVVRCRSFHTAEEYDAMVERIWLSRSQQTGFDVDDGVTKVLLHHSEASSKEESHHADHTDSDIQALDQETIEVVLDASGSCSTAGDVEIEHNIIAKEPKRKAMAKRLRSLSIPTTIEFPAIASLREWIPVGGLTDSPEAYVTPKFGTCDLPIAGTESECRESLPFSPELVEAFEESMKQLEAEEESILLQITEQLEEDSTNGKEPKG